MTNDIDRGTDSDESDDLEHILLDACCLLNLYAAKIIEDIPRVLPVQIIVADRVSSEAIYVLRGDSGDDANEIDVVDLEPFIKSGVLQIARLKSSTEIATFVQFAAGLDDGEAMTCALAVHRRCSVASDDRKVIRLLREHPAAPRIRTTAELVKDWSEGAHLSESALRQVLRDITSRARFRPGKHDPLYGWWESLTRD